MISLFIDTALNFIRIALFKDEVLIDSINEECSKNMSSIFDVRLDSIFKRNNLSINNVDKIYVVTGPGSFTGIRVGMTFAKVLAFSLNKDITPISELQVLASVDSSCNVASLIDARRGYVYAGVYDNNLDSLVCDKYMLLDDFLNSVSDVKFVSYDSFQKIDCSIPNIDFTKLIKKNSNVKQISHQLLVPNYLKLTEAEENLRKKKYSDC